MKVSNSKIKMRWILPAILLLAAGGCTQIKSVGGFGEAPTINTRLQGDSVELVLNPLTVWEQQKNLRITAVDIDGIITQVRLREGDLWEVPYVRAGLFWSSKDTAIILPVAVEQRQPLKIRGAEIIADSHVATLQLAHNFKFTPGGSNPQYVISKASFRLPEETLRAISKSQTAQLVLKTHRGDLSLGLDIVKSSKQAQSNARFMFSLFSREMAAVKANL